MYDTPNVLESPCLTAGLSSPVRDYRLLGSITLGDTTMQHNDTTQVLENNLNRYSNRYLNKNLNTSQQSIKPEVSNENVGRASPPLFASQGASHPGVKEDRKKTKEPKTERKLSPNYLYEEIHLQINKIRDGDRYTRMNCYISLKTDTDMQFSTFLSGNVTSAIYETVRQATKGSEYTILDTIKKYKEIYGNDLLLGRMRYKPANGYKTDMHKTNIPNVLLAIYPVGDTFHATLKLLDEEIHFELTNEVEGKQKEYYNLVGLFRREIKTMNEEDAFE